MKTLLAWIGGLSLAAIAAILATAAAGWYDVGADAPHAAPVEAFLDWGRRRAIAAHAQDQRIALPEGEAALRSGAAHYAEMCAGCHMAPATDDREMRDGLYPRPPDFTKTRPDPSTAFWTIKHGIKMSGMPAWGAAHDDASILAIVAFLQRLPGMDDATYRKLAGLEVAQGAQEPPSPAPAEPHEHHHHAHPH